MERGLLNAGATQSSSVITDISDTHTECKSPHVKQLIDLFREEQGGAQINSHISNQVNHNLKEIKVERSYEVLDDSIFSRGYYPTSNENTGGRSNNADRGPYSYDNAEVFRAGNGRSSGNNSSGHVRMQGSISASGSSARVQPVTFSPLNTCNSQAQLGNAAQCEGYEEDEQPPRRSFSGRSSTTLTGAGYALEGLRFISRTTCDRADQKLQWWEAVERRFHKLSSSNGTLSRSNFAACIGTPSYSLSAFMSKSL